MLKTALFAGVVALATIGSGAHAGPQYDMKIELAARKIVARKIGDIRGSMESLAKLPANEAGQVVIAETDMSRDIKPLAIAFAGPLLAPAKPYHSGRPEPLRKVRTVTSFVYY